MGFINRLSGATGKGTRTHMYKHAHTMVSACSQGCRAGDVSLEREHWKPLCSCSQGVPSFCVGAGMGLNDGRLGGGRDGWWLMCRQRRSLLCVSKAYKAASVCGRTERLGTVAQTQRWCLFSSRDTELFSVLLLLLSRPLSAHLRALQLLGESSSPQCGDATSFSSHYVLIRGRYRGGGG